MIQEFTVGTPKPGQEPLIYVMLYEHSARGWCVDDWTISPRRAAEYLHRAIYASSDLGRVVLWLAADNVDGDSFMLWSFLCGRALQSIPVVLYDLTPWDAQ